MKQEVKIGQADYTVLILVRDSTTGAPKTALTFESAGIDVCYTRVETDNDVVTTDGAPVTTTLTGAHVDWGFVLVDDTKCPGLYKLDIADGVFTTGAWSAVVSFICTGCDPVHLEFVLVPEAPYTGVNASQVGGLSVVSGCIPNAVAGAAGGLFIAGTNAATTVTTSLTTTFTGNLTGSVASVSGAVGSVTGLTASDVGSIKTKTDFLPSVTAGAAGGVFIAGANAATSITTALTANIIGDITGSLSGSVGSIGTAGIAAASFDADAITAEAIAADAIAAAAFADGAITAAAIAADAITAAKVAPDVHTEATDIFMLRDMSKVATGAANGTPPYRMPLDGFRFLRNKWTAVGTALSVMAEDDTTEAWAGTLTHSAAAEPITAIDPD